MKFKTSDIESIKKPYARKKELYVNTSKTSINSAFKEVFSGKREL
jgi:hypothetical protein